MKVKKILAAWRGEPQCEKCQVRHLALFSDLAESDFMGLHLHIEDLEFPAGTIIYHSDEPGRALFTIRSGVVKLVQCLPNGTQRIVRLLRQGATLGLEAVLGEPYRHAAITMQDALICRIPATAIHQLNAQSPTLYTQLMRRWQQSVEQADEWLTFLSTGTARARVARLFLHLNGDSGDAICQLFGREDVAAILGITSETACRIVAEFSRDKVINALSSNRFECDLLRLEEISSN
ncbi:MAG: Crp/Fnr family transcriptional regulator [Propionivibrio sp.]|uniref:Crp/Fnr family transcriptional regulator n=1 Tax=Candidatus Propionivibrio dominans TaxID=2954373 RepID=A0A9D7I800_9RHOO|nr:Crp/Fnr family transcriptional regulator [Candidatus Propionivibrio dominans]